MIKSLYMIFRTTVVVWCAALSCGTSIYLTPWYCPWSQRGSRNDFQRSTTLSKLVCLNCNRPLSYFYLKLISIFKARETLKITRFASIVLYRCLSANKSNRWVFCVFCWLPLIVFPLVTQQGRVEQFREAVRLRALKGI
jgi:hypothetical protein